MSWKNRSVLVTGGTSFIGSNLVHALVDASARVRVVDNLTSGKLENINPSFPTGGVSELKSE